MKDLKYEKARSERLKEGRKLLSEKVKLENAELKSKKFEVKQKEKGKKKFEKIKKILSKRVLSRRILKPSQTTVVLKERETQPYQSVFFKNEWDETKRALFFK
jgi:hypothetical protein